MPKNYPDLTRQVSANLKKLRKDIPDTLQGFSALAQAAGRDGALDKKTKELIALALGVAAHCDACIRFSHRGACKVEGEPPGGGGSTGHGGLHGRRPIPDVCRRRDFGFRAV